MLGTIFKVALGLLAAGSSYFIYQKGSAKLTAAGFDSNSTEFYILFFTSLIPALISIMMVLALMKSPLIKYMMPLIVISGLILTYLHFS